MLNWFKLIFAQTQPQLQPHEMAYKRMCEAIDDLNAAWNNPNLPRKFKPWIDWSNREIILTESRPELTQVYPKRSRYEIDFPS